MELVGGNCSRRETEKMIGGGIPVQDVTPTPPARQHPGSCGSLPSQETSRPTQSEGWRFGDLSGDCWWGGGWEDRVLGLERGELELSISHPQKGEGAIGWEPGDTGVDLGTFLL